MNAAHPVLARRSQRRFRTPKSVAPRHLAFQQLEPRQLLAAIGDWAALDLRSYLTQDPTTDFKDLSGVVFHGNQVAVTANVQPEGADLEARLVLVDLNLDAHTAQVSNNLTIRSLSPGGATEAFAVNSNGSVVYMTGSSVSQRAPDGEAFRATWDGSQNPIQNVGLGSIPGKLSVEPVFESVGYCVNSSGVVGGSSDNNHAIFEYDQAMVYAGNTNSLDLLLGISDDRVKVGAKIMVDISGIVWEADNQTSRFVEDMYGDGTLLLAISPDHSRLLGTSTEIFGDTSSEKLTWWTYAGDATLVEDATGHPIEGRFTGGTNADVGYLVGQAGEPSSGDLLHIESTNQTLRIVDWFESLSGLDLPAETSAWGPEITYDYNSGQVAIISGGYLFTAKIWDDNQPPVAQGDSYATPVGVDLTVDAPGVLANDTDDAAVPLHAVLVVGPEHGTLDLRDDGSFTYTPQSGFNREDAFTYKANDGDYDSNVVTVNITIDTLCPWHNGLKPLDVNDDTFVTAVDALQIINTLNIIGSRELPSRSHPLTKPFYDTSPDNFVSPRDALLVINFLNLGGQPEGEGEGEAVGLRGGTFNGGDILPVLALTTGVSARTAAPLASSASASPAGPSSSKADAWAADVPEVGLATSSMPRDEEVWAEWAEQWGLTDLDDMLSVLLGPATDEA
jgi:hypothetical protein